MTEGHARAIVGALSGLLALGCAALAIGHAGVEVPVLSDIGPGGTRVILPAVIAFTIACLLLAALAAGAFGARPWAWAVGVLVHALIFVGAVLPYRGLASLAALLIAAVCLAVLLTPIGRRAFIAR